MWTNLEKKLPGYGQPCFWFSEFYLAPEFTLNPEGFMRCQWHILRQDDVHLAPVMSSEISVWGKPTDESYRAEKAQDAQQWADAQIPDIRNR